MHAHTCSCLRRHTIPHHQWRIQDFSEGGASGQTQYGKRGRGGGGGFNPPDFCTSGIKISEVVIINCKALAIQ